MIPYVMANLLYGIEVINMNWRFYAYATNFPVNLAANCLNRWCSARILKKNLAATSDRFRFSASVAAFGQLMRGGKYTGEYKLDDVLQLARESRGDDIYGYRSEFLSLAGLAKSLSGSQTASR